MQAHVGIASPLKYIITETGAPSSFDPLDADQTQNLPMMRMLYLTPLEISDDDKLRSSLLSHFSYDQQRKTIIFELRSGLVYSSGEPIQVDDVVLAIKRMAHARPLFPVLREIVGIEEWKKQSYPLKTLPKGMRVHDSRIEMQLVEDIDHPLFRFTLELFSIIPRRCINLETGKMVCTQPPFSGPYELISPQDGYKSGFRRRKILTDSFYKNIPEEIVFEFLKPQDLLVAGKIAGSGWVAAGSERFYTPTEVEKIRTMYAFNGLVKNRFSVLLLNPNIDAFRNRECRRFFAEQFRAAVVDAGFSPDTVEGSVSPKVISGYQTLDELRKAVGSFDNKQESICRKAFKDVAVPWGVPKSMEKQPEVIAIKSVFTRLGMKITEPEIFEDRSKDFDAFSSGRTAIHFGSSGLWALDPFGDLQMLFTPNLHKSLTFVSTDQKMQRMLARLRRTDVPEERKSLAVEFNRHMFSEALFSIYGHSRRFFVSQKGSSLEKIPMAISGAAPWQVFSNP